MQTWCANIRCVDHSHLGAKADYGIIHNMDPYLKVSTFTVAPYSVAIVPVPLPVLQSQGMAGIQSQRGVVAGNSLCIATEFHLSPSPAPPSPGITGVQSQRGVKVRQGSFMPTEFCLSPSPVA